ncbi:hypothetical protein J4E90_004274 [Alternaria incomplexa]|uniref:uncharacterized protein n=1 Tax=Alternaria incomplexa TaxID=1187928 RepID=UPI0022208E4B|nr:uncharacterized protein J4E90_004274 [Alternaria incomplexa]KAI4915828.1 hypothetical protein J4E90_004274 [Alternaria incomplexa]
MANMFRDFSFDPAPSPDYSAYEAERAAMNVSPTSQAMDPHYAPNRLPTPPCTMGDLAVQLNQQSLRIDTSVRCYPAGPLTPESDDECAPSTKQEQQARPTYSRIAASVLRMQRQQSSRMQCSSSHARDLSKLVQMIEEEKQCTVSESSSRTSSTYSTSTCASGNSGDDEGVDMDYDVPASGIESLASMPVWKAHERRDSCVRVTRPVRMRKRSKGNGVSKRRSS